MVVVFRKKDLELQTIDGSNLVYMVFITETGDLNAIFHFFSFKKDILHLIEILPNEKSIGFYKVSISVHERSNHFLIEFLENMASSYK